jgi:SAM-dependent methyltransferase
LIIDELELLARLVPLDGQRIVEIGCGAAQLARSLLARHPGAQVLGLEVDERQHAKNLAAAPVPGLRFEAAGAQALPLADGSMDLALMLKSLHHVPLPLLGSALAEAARVLRPGGHLYVSEPVFAGPLNEVVRLFNDEQAVRAAAQAALDAALNPKREAEPGAAAAADAGAAPAQGPWEAAAELHFDMPVRYTNFDDFAQRMLNVTFAERRVDDAKLERIRAAFEQHIAPCASTLVRPMHARLLRRRAA